MRKQTEKGFTIIEALVVIVAGGILIAATVGTYKKILEIHRRQQQVLKVERELNSIQLNIKKGLTTRPGRELGYYGDEFTIARLPAIESGKGPIELGLVTPLKIGGNDAVTIVYGRREYGRRNEPCESALCQGELARMELAERSREVLGQGIVRVAVPGVTKAEELPFKAGDLMLLVGLSPTALKGAQSEARLVRLNGAAKKVKAGSPARDLMEFNFNFCESGSCGAQFPQLRNRTTQKIFAIGSALIPLNVITYYLSNNGSRKVVIRNDGGEIVGREDGIGFEISGGGESILGEAESIKISYLLKNEEKKDTPPGPQEEWIKEIKGVEVELSKSEKTPFGNEEVSRRLNLSYAITIRTLE